jgi:hypothetical protein
MQVRDWSKAIVDEIEEQSQWCGVLVQHVEFAESCVTVFG